MYRTCLFCSSDLGHNEAVEHFPVGRRLAFDAAKGRLWVVCRKCERWNLTPLEERWEAIEECERAFRGTRLRVSTDQIGLAKLREGLELVRIGDPQRPEMAAWRYGDQFGRRRRRKYLIAGGVAVAGATVMVAGPMLGIIGAGAISPLTNLVSTGTNLYRARKMVIVPGAEGRVLRTRLSDVDRVKMDMLDGELTLHVPVVPGKSPRWSFSPNRETVTLTGEDAVRAAGALLPKLNSGGGSAEQVQRAVGIIEQAGSPTDLFWQAARDLRNRSASGWGDPRRRTALKRIPVTTRLALEMATHEESERRALEGELYLLEEAWKQAEEVAAIADDMFLPASVDQDLARLRAARTDEPRGER
ncbi:MAG TPA: hypothetical protein VF461_04445 [Gemmatimonadaceae bacterium]